MPAYFYLIRYKKDYELTDEQRLLPPEMQRNIIKRKYKMMLDALPYSEEEWKMVAKTFMSKEHLTDVSGLYRVFEVDIGEMYAEQIGRLMAEFELFELF